MKVPPEGVEGAASPSAAHAAHVFVVVVGAMKVQARAAVRAARRGRATAVGAAAEAAAADASSFAAARVVVTRVIERRALQRLRATVDIAKTAELEVEMVTADNIVIE